MNKTLCSTNNIKCVKTQQLLRFEKKLSQGKKVVKYIVKASIHENSFKISAKKLN